MVIFEERTLIHFSFQGTCYIIFYISLDENLSFFNYYYYCVFNHFFYLNSNNIKLE